jgi:hypothetical protein
MASLHTQTVTDLKALVGDLIESLSGAFPDCGELKGWCQTVSSNVELTDEPLMEFLRRITAFMVTPIPHKMVKYDRAILSITGEPLNVYQVVMYKDIGVLSTVFPQLQPLNMEEKIKSLTGENVGMFWQFLHEAINLTLRATQTIPPIVPTTQRIAENIEKRRRQRDSVNTPSSTSNGGMSISDGVDDLWRELCHTRNLKPTSMSKELSERVARLVKAETSGDDMCKHFPELGTHRYSDESLAITHRIGSLCTMTQAIPVNMMSGIERVASSLVRDINSGKIDFASLDIEKIGEQVLRGVEENDVGEFANNLERILPALQSMGGGIDN